MRKIKTMYPNYARSERIADGTMHAIGVTGALAGTICLMIWTVGMVSGGQIAALVIYGIALIATFTASAFYHMTPWENIRPLLRRIDHAAIYLKIAGTYTPLVVMIGSMFGYIMLGIVWALALFGMIRKLFFWENPGRLGSVLYLVMGWMSLGLIWALVPILPGVSTGLIVAGGLLYTAGVVFFSWESLKFSNAIWHGFVVAASACFFVAIAYGAVATA
ncbi:hemolysin III [Cognatiyoonia koreensis]|uniref:Hemolysin III n=1 Tax=Cognatiyoonia koreensis TaxID=364200 RepID=A0A1I0N5I6_9RHOB|nr:hemolysin III family protein [Cognatiyoonia koreensis]SEV95619.1 hemolysin III [Cognatiyoonia koreensis]